MKYALVALLLFTASLSGVNLINEAFSSPPDHPAGWTATGPNPSA